MGTRPRPALTSSGSPVVSRNRASARLIADGLSRNRWAARATLPSASSTSRVTSRLRSGVDMQPTIAQLDRDVASNARIKCKWCAFRHVSAKDYVSDSSVSGAAGNGVHVEANHCRTRRGSRWKCGTDTFGSVGARRPFALHAAVLARHQHRQCRLADAWRRRSTPPSRTSSGSSSPISSPSPP